MPKNTDTERDGNASQRVPGSDRGRNAGRIASLTLPQRIALERALGDKRASQIGVVPRSDPATHPLSFGQRRLWVLQRLIGDSPAYNIPAVLKLTGWLDRTALQHSLDYVRARHEVLRARFTAVDGDPRQMIDAPDRRPIDYVDLSHLPPLQRSDVARRLARDEARRPFDLECGPLLRVTLVRMEPEQHLLLLTVHHIVFDGGALGVLLRELSAAYDAYIDQREPRLPPLPIQYADFAVWQRERLQGPRLERELAFWRAKLARVAPLELPTDRPRPALQTFRGAEQRFAASPDLTARIKAVGRRASATTFMTLMAAFQAFLTRYTGQTNVAVATSVSGRPTTATEALIGYFVNTLVFPTDVSDNPSFSTLLGRVREEAIELFSHQELPFDRLIEELNPSRDASRNPLFQAIFEFRSEPVAMPDLRGLRAELTGGDSGTVKADLMLETWERNGRLEGGVTYNVDLFDSASIERLIGHFTTLLTSLVTHPERRLAWHPLLTESERDDVTRTCNRTEVELPPLCVHHLFEAQTRRTPHALAVVDSSAALTYCELNERADRLASRLRRAGTGPEVRVGICLPRSTDMMVALLAVLKAGGAYVPLDPAYPADRLAFIAKDAGVRILLTIDALRDRVGTAIERVIAIDQEAIAIAAEAPIEPSAVDPQNLAYVIYTSGSTGRPKGVAIEHRGLVNYLLWGAKVYGAGEGSGSAVQSSIGFDLTLTSLLLPLVAGTTVRLLPEQDPIDALADSFSEPCDLSLLKITPAHLDLLNRRLSPDRAAGRVRTLVIGGDALGSEALAFWRRHAPATRLINEYGPTETVVGCSIYPITTDVAPSSALPIGWPIANTSMYALDTHGEPTPVGIRAELYIGGAGVARGYWNRPDLTADRFRPDPFCGRPGGRMYRSGDLVRRRPDGNLDFFGRLDHQVKLRGFRIELGEIEVALMGHPAIRETVVTVHDSPKGQQLVAYVVPQDHLVPPSITDLRQFLKASLPDYMLPAAVVGFDAMPLTPNGKIDRKRLPRPEDVRPSIGSTFAKPRNSLELAIAVIWEDIFNVRPIGVKDNFFDLGGHSFLALRLAARIAAQFGMDLPLSAVFQEPTVEQLAAVVRRQGSCREWPALVPLQPSGSRSPFFCVHSVGGQILRLYDLARRMAPDHPFFGIQAPPASDLAGAAPSIECLAVRYVTAVRAVQPAGPYFLGGYSYGGAIAFEMAQQMTRVGDRVALVAVIDGVAPGVTAWKELDDADLVVGFARDIARTAGRDLPLNSGELSGAATDHAIATVIHTLRDLGLVGPEIDAAYAKAFLDGVKARHRALTEYQPTQYNGHLVLFRSTEIESATLESFGESAAMFMEPARGWDRLCTQPAGIRPIAGHHVTIVTEPVVETLAAALKSEIDRAATDAGRRGERS